MELFPVYIPFIFFFVLGAIIGSFLNVVIFRLGTGRAPSGRSHCLSCGKTLGVFELVPILSFFFLLGRCSKCKSKISFQYPFVELVTGFTFLFIYNAFASSLNILHTANLLVIGELGLSLFVASILIVIAVYDFRHKIIPEKLSFIFIICGLGVAIFRFIEQYQFGLSSFLILDIIAGPLLFLLFYGLWKVSSGRWMGFADSRLALGIGLTLGFVEGFSAVTIAVWIGAILGLLLIGISKVLPPFRLSGGLNTITMKTEIPFAPFLILGMAIVFFLKINVFSLF